MGGKSASRARNAQPSADIDRTASLCAGLTRSDRIVSSLPRWTGHPARTMCYQEEARFFLLDTQCILHRQLLKSHRQDKECSRCSESEEIFPERTARKHSGRQEHSSFRSGKQYNQTGPLWADIILGRTASKCWTCTVSKRIQRHN